MERSIVPVVNYHGNEQGSNSAAASSQSGRSSAENCSLSIVLGSIPVPRIEAGECKHFGMRQYVLSMREKDKSICLPFNSDGNSEQFLPPMIVQQYKYWRCENCLHGNGSVSRLEDVLLISDCYRCQPISKEMKITENGQENVDRGETEEGTDDQVAVNGQLVNHSSIQIKDPEGPRKKKRIVKDCMRQMENSESSRLRIEGSFSLSQIKGNHIENILGVRVPQRKRNLRITVGTSKANADGVAEKSSQKRRGCMPPRQQSGQNSSLTKKRKGSDKHVAIQIDLTLNSNMPSHKDGKDHSKAGRGVISSISYRDFMRKFNFCAGESSVTHKFTAGPYLDAQQKNLIEKFARSFEKQLEQRKISPLPSDKNIHLVQILDFSDPLGNNVHQGGANESSKGKRIQNLNMNVGNTSLLRSDENVRQASRVPVKLFGVYLDQEMGKGPYARTDVCAINQNPADFSYPDADNEYMIKGEDLKVGNDVLSRGKTVRKKQRGRKNKPANERAQHRDT